MPSSKLLSSFRTGLIVFTALLWLSCGGTSGVIEPPITNPPGSDHTGIFFASSIGGGITGLSAASGQLTEVVGSRISLVSGARGFGADPGGAFLVATSYIPESSPLAQVIDVQSGGRLSLGPSFALGGHSDGVAVNSGRIAITDMDNSTVTLYAYSGGSITQQSSAGTDAEPHGVIFDSSGRHLYVANYVGGTVSVFSVSGTGQLQLQQSVPQTPPLNFLPFSPKAIRLNPSGTKLAVACHGAVMVWSVNQTDGTLSAPVDKQLTLYTIFQDLIWDPSGQMLYLLDTENSIIYGYSVSDSFLTPLMGTPMATAATASGIAMNATGDRLYALEMVAQIQTFERNTSSGGLTASEVLPVHISFLPTQIVRVPQR